MILDFGSFTRGGMLADLECPAEMCGTDRRQSRVGEAGEAMVEDTNTINLPVVR